MIPALIGGLFGLGTGIANIVSNRQAEEREYNRQLDMMQSQRDWDMQMWNMQNEYNSPINQMDRLRAAGLNPNLMYEVGSVGNSSSLPSSSTQQPRARSSDYAPIIGGAAAFANIFRTLKETEKLDSDIETNAFYQNLLAAQADGARELAVGHALDNTAKGIQSRWSNYIQDFLFDRVSKEGTKYGWLSHNSKLLQKYLDGATRGALENLSALQQFNNTMYKDTINRYKTYGTLNTSTTRETPTHELWRQMLPNATSAAANTVLSSLMSIFTKGKTKPQFTLGRGYQQNGYDQTFTSPFLNF